jgi:hypothetical protein
MTKADMLKWAEECRLYADRVTDPETKQSYMAAAMTWLELAQSDEANDESTQKAPDSSKRRPT